MSYIHSCIYIHSLCWPMNEYCLLSQGAAVRSPLQCAMLTWRRDIQGVFEVLFWSTRSTAGCDGCLYWEPYHRPKWLQNPSYTYIHTCMHTYMHKQLILSICFTMNLITYMHSYIHTLILCNKFAIFISVQYIFWSIWLSSYSLLAVIKRILKRIRHPDNNFDLGKLTVTEKDFTLEHTYNATQHRPMLSETRLDSYIFHTYIHTYSHHLSYVHTYIHT